MKPDFDLAFYLAERRVMVNKALEEALPESHEPSGQVVEAMRYSLFIGGKRLRPILALAGAEAVGGQAEDALPAAVALEMIHTSSLIHDDLPGMDDDDLRRGKPSNHKVYGEGMAILAGDGLLIEGLVFLAGISLSGRIDPLRALAAMDVVSNAVGHRGMVGGQAVDLLSEGRVVGEDVVHFIHTHKTADLIAAAITAGGILGGGTEEQIRSLKIFGQNIGLAFQVIDDILDIEGKTVDLGKPAGSDQAKGKATYPSVVGMSRAKETAADLVNEAHLALEPFGSEAEPLRVIAGYLLTRKK